MRRIALVIHVLLTSSLESHGTKKLDLDTISESRLEPRNTVSILRCYGFISTLQVFEVMVVMKKSKKKGGLAQPRRIQRRICLS